MQATNFTGANWPASAGQMQMAAQTMAAQMQSESYAGRPTSTTMLDTLCHNSQQLLPRLNQILNLIEHQGFSDMEASASNVPTPVQTINIRLMNSCDNLTEAHRVLNAIEAALGV